MASAYGAPLACVEIPEHFCNPCDDVELGKVRHAMFIPVSYALVDRDAPTVAEIEAGMASLDIKMIPRIEGSHDGGAGTEGVGRGDQDVKITSRKFTGTIMDYAVRTNTPFWNAMNRSTNHELYYWTGGGAYRTGVPVSINAAAPVPEAIDAEVKFNVGLKWSSFDLPRPVDLTADIFDFCSAGN